MHTDTTRAIVLSAVVVLSVAAGSIAFAGSASAAASNLGIVSEQPVKGSGTLTVSVAVSTVGANATFTVEDAAGTVSAARTVTDGGSGDDDPTDGVVEATLDLDAMFDEMPASGTGIVYAAEGTTLSVSQQTFDTKQQVEIDSQPPSVAVTGGSTGDPEPISAYAGDQITVYYDMSDVPENVESASMRFVAPDGTTMKEVTGLQTGTDRGVQFTIPSDWSGTEFNITMTAIDEAGYVTTDTFVDGLRVRSGDPSIDAKNLEIVSGTPVKGTGNVTVRTSVTADGARASFKVEDANGIVSATRTVTDGGPADESATAGVVEATFRMDALFDEKPSSGTGIFYAAGGVEDFSVSKQTYDTKQQAEIDADAPYVIITGGKSNPPRRPTYAQTGHEVQITFTITDKPQKVSDATMQIRGPDGTLLKTIDDLQAGEDQHAQFKAPLDWTEGDYDVTLTAVDEVGYTTTDHFEGGLVIDNTHPTFRAVWTGDRVGGPSQDTYWLTIDLQENTKLDTDTVDEDDFDVPNYQEENAEVTLAGDILLELEPPDDVDLSDDAPLLERGERPAVSLVSGAYIADMAGNRLEGENQITDAAMDGLVPRNPNFINVTPDSIEDPSNVTVGVHFVKRQETSSGYELVAQPPEGGTVYVRFTGPNGTQVVRSMPADTDAETSSATFDLTGTGLDAGDVKVEAKIMDDSASAWENPHGYDAPEYVTLENSTA